MKIFIISVIEYKENFNQIKTRNLRDNICN